MSNHVTPIPSNRAFGGLFAVMFGLIGLWSLWKQGSAYPWWFGASVLTLLVTLAAPGLLAPLNRVWMKLAEVLHRIVSPVVLGVLFFLVITPFGWVRRRSGWDPMRRKYDPAGNSYWIDRTPPGPNPDSLPNQF